MYHQHIGWQRNDLEAFCGRGLIQDAYIHFRRNTVELRTYPYVCFAYKGAGLTGEAYAHIDYYSKGNIDYKLSCSQILSTKTCMLNYFMVKSFQPNMIFTL